MNHSTLPVYGIDFGSTNVSVGVLEGESAESYFTSLDSSKGSLNTHESIKRFVERLNPPKGSMVFIEGVFKGINQNTYGKMIKVSHSLEISFQGLGCSVEHLHASSWRSTLFGTSKVKKEYCQEWAAEQFPFLLDYKKSERGHRADSLCIALGGAVRHGLITLNQ